MRGEKTPWGHSNILWGQYYPDTKTRQRHHKKRKLMTKISHEHRCKNPQQTTGKPNLATFGDLYTMMKWNLSQECKLGLCNIKKKKNTFILVE